VGILQEFVKNFQEIGKEDLLLVGGKGLNLGQLAKIPEIHVPAGFCITTDAFKEVVGGNRGVEELLHELSLLTIADKEEIRAACENLRSRIESLAIPEELERQIVSSIEKFGEETAFAVRSSATAEDLPGSRPLF
jgi:phosphoenolpyruvate synthase/pyruvate phosphate dikinase